MTSNTCVEGQGTCSMTESVDCVCVCVTEDLCVTSNTCVEGQGTCSMTDAADDIICTCEVSYTGVNCETSELNAALLSGCLIAPTFWNHKSKKCMCLFTGSLLQ